MTKIRRRFKDWCDRHAKQLREPTSRGTNYVSGGMSKSEGKSVEANQPFPNNPAFRSEPVLSERARQMVWHAVMVKGMPLKAVSAEYSVDVRRVAAVVRLKEVEKRWEREVSF